MSTKMDDGTMVLTTEDKQVYLDNMRLNEKKRDDIFNTKKAKLKEYLISIDPEKADDALKALVQIASEHKSATLTVYNEEDGRYERVKAITVKRAMQKLQPPLKKLSEILKSIPLSDLALFDAIMYECAQTPSFSKLIVKAYETTDSVILKQSNHMENSTDKDRTVLACSVALVIKNILKKKVVTTPLTALGRKAKPTSALYARLLDMTLKLADESSVDMQKLRIAGKKLSKDGTLPHLIN